MRYGAAIAVGFLRPSRRRVLQIGAAQLLAGFEISLARAQDAEPPPAAPTLNADSVTATDRQIEARWIVNAGASTSEVRFLYFGASGIQEWLYTTPYDRFILTDTPSNARFTVSVRSRIGLNASPWSAVVDVGTGLPAPMPPALQSLPQGQGLALSWNQLLTDRVDAKDGIRIVLGVRWHGSADIVTLYENMPLTGTIVLAPNAPVAEAFCRLSAPNPIQPSQRHHSGWSVAAVAAPTFSLPNLRQLSARNLLSTYYRSGM